MAAMERDEVTQRAVVLLLYNIITLNGFIDYK